MCARCQSRNPLEIINGVFFLLQAAEQKNKGKSFLWLLALLALHESSCVMGGFECTCLEKGVEEGSTRDFDAVVSPVIRH